MSEDFGASFSAYWVGIPTLWICEVRHRVNSLRSTPAKTKTEGPSRSCAGLLSKKCQLRGLGCECDDFPLLIQLKWSWKLAEGTAEDCLGYKFPSKGSMSAGA